ncbi:uncharacterized protein LOC125719117 [Brienomyrus brachyistius]|uniref:uncharacterized protein LOC125719117 n=1 Tax=Brienomyrus brachyistius TaxID=42636 RepID=UPI0020B237F8|nr:uncharacterized protein LOC125719117 [Brienomyrus brachyistius]
MFMIESTRNIEASPKKMVSHLCLFVFAVFGLRSIIADKVKCKTSVDSRTAVLDCHIPYLTTTSPVQKEPDNVPVPVDPAAPSMVPVLVVSAPPSMVPVPAPVPAPLNPAPMPPAPVAEEVPDPPDPAPVLPAPMTPVPVPEEILDYRTTAPPPLVEEELEWYPLGIFLIAPLNPYSG